MHIFCLTFLQYRNFLKTCSSSKKKN